MAPDMGFFSKVELSFNAKAYKRKGSLELFDLLMLRRRFYLYMLCNRFYILPTIFSSQFQLKICTYNQYLNQTRKSFPYWPSALSKKRFADEIF